MQAYLLHFNKPYRHARHYLGITTNLAWRLRRHSKGTGARLLRAVKADGVKWRIAREWEEADKPEDLTWREFEKRLKARGGHARLCPICKAEKAKKGKQA